MPAPTERFLPVRVALILAAIALCQGFSACWITGSLGMWLPFSGSIPLTSLPHILCGLAVAMAALVAPFISGPGNPSEAEGQSSQERPRLKLLQLIFTALWQSAMFCFFLMVCARLTPLDPGGITLATLWVAAFAFCFFTGQSAGLALAGAAAASIGTRGIIVAGAVGVLIVALVFSRLKAGKAANVATLVG